MLLNSVLESISSLKSFGSLVVKKRGKKRGPVLFNEVYFTVGLVFTKLVVHLKSGIALNLLIAD